MSAFLFHLARSATVAPLATLAGTEAQRLRLPRITGFLMAGILTGPYCLNIITEEAVKELWPVDFVCLSTIAVAAGSELQTSELNRTRKQVLLLLPLPITLSFALPAIGVLVPLLWSPVNLPGHHIVLATIPAACSASLC